MKITGLRLWEQRGILVTHRGGRRTRLNFQPYSGSSVTQSFARAYYLNEAITTSFTSHFFGILQVEIRHIFKIILPRVLS